MKKEFKRIKKFSKKFIGRRNYKKIKKIKNFNERTEGLKYLIASKFKLQFLELEFKIKEIEKKEALIIEAKLARLSAKIKIFESTYKKRDFLALQKLIKEIEKELKNV